MGHAPLDWPGGCNSCFCLRVDVDTVRDAKACSQLLPLLRENGVRATFFVATGPDDSGRNVFRALKRRGGKRYAARYGLDGLRGLLLPALDVEEQLGAWREILDQGHEIALHGYWHRIWARDATGWTEGETRKAVEEGLRRFERSFSFKPRGFAAPSFKTNANLGKVLWEAGFAYSSNTRAGGPIDPPESLGPVVEIPVTCMNAEELMLEGATEEEASERAISSLEASIAGRKLFCYYVHPYFELGHRERAFRKLLLLAGRRGAWTPTMGESADWLRRSRPEDTSDL
ncbi:MAG: polysaccharide deacetylase family protein [Candidatus Brockarchaeota archaeon]|nr:polysaccharide deacetylase family protein [Candidatus Brockarchaeota archaeon]